jgi:hypothetical protein
MVTTGQQVDQEALSSLISFSLLLPFRFQPPRCEIASFDRGARLNLVKQGIPGESSPIRRYLQTLS